MRWQSMTWGFPSMLKGPWSLQILFDTGEAPNIQKVFAENRNDKKHSWLSFNPDTLQYSARPIWLHVIPVTNASAHQRRLNHNPPGQDMRWNWWNSPAVDKTLRWKLGPLSGVGKCPIEHHPTIGDINSNRYLKVIFKIPNYWDIYQPLSLSIFVYLDDDPTS